MELIISIFIIILIIIIIAHILNLKGFLGFQSIEKFQTEKDEKEYPSKCGKKYSLENPAFWRIDLELKPSKSKVIKGSVPHPDAPIGVELFTNGNSIDNSSNLPLLHVLILPYETSKSVQWSSFGSRKKRQLSPLEKLSMESIRQNASRYFKIRFVSFEEACEFAGHSVVPEDPRTPAVLAKWKLKTLSKYGGFICNHSTFMTNNISRIANIVNKEPVLVPDVSADVIDIVRSDLVGGPQGHPIWEQAAEDCHKLILMTPSTFRDPLRQSLSKLAKELNLKLVDPKLDAQNGIDSLKRPRRRDLQEILESTASPIQYQAAYLSLDFDELNTTPNGWLNRSPGDQILAMQNPLGDFLRDQVLIVKNF